ncbi:unnamed protein product [Arctia plantaginis]|uniref:Uncharacterized protein n=1 Tax=Arctia plantaginis TaxID=874455 RepID=A0A8S1B390_ARCPL|nr:unnamed protein product [Arctia plantaginis]
MKSSGRAPWFEQNPFNTTANSELPGYQRVIIQVLAYVVTHTFGLRLIYPGSMAILQSMLSMRNQSLPSQGKILVICCEGNSGFYEFGIMTTPVKAGYSALGWNHPRICGEYVFEGFAPAIFNGIQRGGGGNKQMCPLRNITFKMSHINDLIGVLRGLRLVAEAGIKTQKEATSLIWHNSSMKALAQNCPSTNPLAFNPNPTAVKEFMERALVVAHGFRQYALIQIPNLNNTVDQPKMDQHLQEELEELNREFNRTFEYLNEAQSKKDRAISEADLISPLEDLKVKSEIVAKPQPKPQTLTPPPPKDSNTSQIITPPVPKPVAKKKMRIAVSVRINFKLFR